jgi:hypothetical protein
MTGSNTFVVERAARVDAPSSNVLERIVDLRRWQAWSPWEDVDPQLRRDYGGADSGVGATYAWEGNRRAGKGRMEIVGVEATGGTAVVTIGVHFVKPFKSESTSVFRLDDDGGATAVTWTMTGPRTLMTKVMGVFTSMDKVLGPDLEKGLDRLKSAAEAG